VCVCVCTCIYVYMYMHIYTHSLDQKKPKIKLLPCSILYLLYSILLHTTYFAHTLLTLLHTTYFTPYFTYFTPHYLLYSILYLLYSTHFTPHYSAGPKEAKDQTLQGRCRQPQRRRSHWVNKKKRPPLLSIALLLGLF